VYITFADGGVSDRSLDPILLLFSVGARRCFWPEHLHRVHPEQLVQNTNGLQDVCIAKGAKT
jgi:hypothetical protein